MVKLKLDLKMIYIEASLVLLDVIAMVKEATYTAACHVSESR